VLHPFFLFPWFASGFLAVFCIHVFASVFCIRGFNPCFASAAYLFSVAADPPGG
jgi:hypothetical protein